VDNSLVEDGLGNGKGTRRKFEMRLARSNDLRMLNVLKENTLDFDEGLRPDFGGVNYIDMTEVTGPEAALLDM